MVITEEEGVWRWRREQRDWGGGGGGGAGGSRLLGGLYFERRTQDTEPKTL